MTIGTISLVLRSPQGSLRKIVLFRATLSSAAPWEPRRLFSPTLERGLFTFPVPRVAGPGMPSASPLGTGPGLAGACGETEAGPGQVARELAATELAGLSRRALSLPAWHIGSGTLTVRMVHALSGRSHWYSCAEDWRRPSVALLEEMTIQTAVNKRRTCFSDH